LPLPYPLPPLDLAAPFDRHRGRVRSEWADGNRHMNVGFYLVAFDHATDTISEQLGIDWRYVEHRLGRVFAVSLRREPPGQVDGKATSIGASVMDTMIVSTIAVMDTIGHGGSNGRG
jgi:acyl-CoA thioester hydrolase